MPGLIDKLGDNKVAVRQANGRLLAVLMETLQPGVVLGALSPAFMHGNWKVREAVVNIFIQVHKSPALLADWAVFRFMLCCQLKFAVGDCACQSI